MSKPTKRVLDLSAAETPAPTSTKAAEKRRATLLARYQKEYQAAVNGTAKWLKALRRASTNLKKHQDNAARLERLLRVFPLR